MEQSDSSINSNHRIIASILLIATTILWGTSFIITKTLTQDVPVLLYLGLRFLIGALGFIPFLYNYKKFNKELVLLGVITCTVNFLSMVFQTYGLQTISAGRAAFITGLGTIFVPFMVWIGYKQKLKIKNWIAALLSIIGMGFLFLEGLGGLFIGDILVLVCATMYALYIVLNDKYVQLVDIYLYSFIQLLIMSILGFGGSFIISETFDFTSVGGSFWFALIYLGIIVTTLTFIFINWAQKQNKNPVQTAIIYNLEPVFAVIFAFLIGNETLNLLEIIGCSIIFLATFIAVYEKNRKNTISN
jgi:drug/metabolite transporter (DMT)-like permease